MPDRSGDAIRQAALLDSLIRGQGYPPGFPSAQADTAGRSLRAKRARATRHQWPALAASLGAEFVPRFDAFTRTTGAPTHVDSLTDGLEFAAWLGTDDPAITEEVRVEVLLARAVVRRRRGRTIRRRGVFVGAQRLAATRRVLIVARAPRLGRRHMSVPLGRRFD